MYAMMRVTYQTWHLPSWKRRRVFLEAFNDVPSLYDSNLTEDEKDIVQKLSCCKNYASVFRKVWGWALAYLTILGMGFMAFYVFTKLET